MQKTFLTTGSAALLVIASAACGDDTTSSTGTGASGAGGASGGACEPSEGCPDVVSDCVAFTDNAGKDTFSLRISQLDITTPAALSSPVVAGLLNLGITQDFPACTSPDGFPLFNGDGSFNWIFEFNKTAGTVRTGGAALETDPTAGYCYINEMIDGFDVAPLELPVTFEANGSFTLTGTADVVVPIYTSPTDATSFILLPLRGVQISGGTISEDNNCIGTFNGDGLDPQNLCLASDDAPAFLGGATLEGYITLEDADAIEVPQLGDASLCSLLVPAEFVMDGKCIREAGEITYEGDWCAGMPNTAGSAATATCKDAVRLSSTFTASGATLRSDCN